MGKSKRIVTGAVLVLTLLGTDIFFFNIYVNQAAIHGSPKGGYVLPFFIYSYFNTYAYLKIAVIVVSMCNLAAALLIPRQQLLACLALAGKTGFLLLPLFTANGAYISEILGAA